MPIETILLLFKGLPAVYGLISAVLCIKFFSKRPYVIILFGLLGALIGLGL